MKKILATLLLAIPLCAMAGPKNNPWTENTPRPTCIELNVIPIDGGYLVDAVFSGIGYWDVWSRDLQTGRYIQWVSWGSCNNGHVEAIFVVPSVDTLQFGAVTYTVPEWLSFPHP